MLWITRCELGKCAVLLVVVILLVFFFRGITVRRYNAHTGVNKLVLDEQPADTHWLKIKTLLSIPSPILCRLGGSMWPTGNAIQQLSCTVAWYMGRKGGRWVIIGKQMGG